MLISAPPAILSWWAQKALDGISRQPPAHSFRNEAEMRRSIVAAGVVALGMVGMAGTAVAANTNAVITQSTKSYSSPSNSSSLVHDDLKRGVPVVAGCFSEGQRLSSTTPGC
jgi:hypothetical protein